RVRSQMQSFLDELSTAGRVHEAFIESFEEDLDGEGTQREDLAVIARARLRVWGLDSDALARSFELLRWLRREVLPFAFPKVPLPELNSIEDASAVGRALEEPVVAARDRW